ncbi:MAG TPA: hypothetical protein PLJ40_03305 [Paludibacteraceae bacterium]|nr:hypothetical protein [Paludibacteraceae bacterium]HQB69336.1 hypothetical protein [Paludibacteraceae bacterium]
MMKHKIAQLFSFVFMPYVTPIYAVLMLVNMWYTRLLFDDYQRLMIVFSITLFTAIIPALTTTILIYTGMVSDFYIINRKERTWPYIITFLSYLACVSFLVWIGIGKWVVLLALGTTFGVVIISLVNLAWKISAHMSGMGGLCGAIFAASFLFHTNPSWLFITIILLSGLVAWSRLELKAHTPGQLIAGFLVGFLGTFLPILLL